MSRPQRRERAMRGAESGQVSLFSYVSLQERILADHPLRAMRALVESVLRELSPRLPRGTQPSPRLAGGSGVRAFNLLL